MFSNESIHPVLGQCGSWSHLLRPCSKRSSLKSVHVVHSKTSPFDYSGLDDRNRTHSQNSIYSLDLIAYIRSLRIKVAIAPAAVASVRGNGRTKPQR